MYKKNLIKIQKRAHRTSLRTSLRTLRRTDTPHYRQGQLKSSTVKYSILYSWANGLCFKFIFCQIFWTKTKNKAVLYRPKNVHKIGHTILPYSILDTGLCSILHSNCTDKRRLFTNFWSWCQNKAIFMLHFHDFLASWWGKYNQRIFQLISEL